MNNLEKAIELLKDSGYTFVAVGGGEVITSTERGVKPLLEILDRGKNLHKFSVADKVVGKAAAFLYVLLEPSEICTDVISRPALEVLENNGINIKYKTLTEAILNRTHTGFCPMETAVKNTSEAVTALSLIHEKLRQLNN
ncbi:MAG: DUF1893 domain-containing protein [Ruminococcus sp.]|nr:DUF1893 domain-containing protein [Ruminococcus sp.]